MKMLTKVKPNTHTVILAIIVMALLVFSGCATEVDAPLPTETPLPTDAPVEEDSPLISFDTGDLAAGYWVGIVDAVAEGSSVPYWELLPEYSRATLDAYVISNHLMKPQIFMYPVEELTAANEGAAAVAASLQTLLDAPQEIENMPLLPLFNAGQMLHTQVKYLDFQNGQGVRYVTMLSQGLVPVNNYELIYTYQGLTNDGRYYVAVILPVHHSDLPPDSSVTSIEPTTYTDDYPAYLEGIINVLNPQPADSFSPNLTALDAMISSLLVQ
jgi:hypothetical protein